MLSVPSAPSLPRSLHKTLLHIATQQEGVHKPRLDQLLEVRILKAFGADPSQPTQGSLGREGKIHLRNVIH